MPCTSAVLSRRPLPVASACRHVLPVALALMLLPLASTATNDGVHRDQPEFIGGYRMPQAPMANVDECSVVFRDGFDPFPGGVLSRPAAGGGYPMTYLTHGGYTIKIDRHTITITDRQGMNTVQHWGDPHENLNGKHLKDWGGRLEWTDHRRSIVLGDGTKLTMEASGPLGMVEFTSIYDEYRNVQFDNVANLVRHYSTDIVDTQDRDAAQYDGETALFDTDPLSRIASYDNIYDETFDTGGQPVRVPIDQALGTTGGCANPHQVNDLFDDPRLGHT